MDRENTRRAAPPADPARRVVLVTGGRRVGSRLALDLAGCGWNVAMTYFSSPRAIEQTISEAAALGAEGLTIQADLTKADHAAAAVAAVGDRFGRIDALVNMVSVYRRTPFESLAASDFDDMIAANLAAPYHAATAAARRMREQSPVDGVKGKIVNFGDWATERPYRNYLPYLTAKGGLTAMTLALAKELAPEIAVTMIQPAMVAPPPDMSEAEIQNVIDQTPLKRCGVPEDVNRLVLYLLEGTNFVTGACFRVDGGRFLGDD